MHFQHHCSYLLYDMDVLPGMIHDEPGIFPLVLFFFCLLSFVLRCVMPVAGPLIPAQTSTFYVYVFQYIRGRVLHLFSLLPYYTYVLRFFTFGYLPGTY